MKNLVQIAKYYRDRFGYPFTDHLAPCDPSTSQIIVIPIHHEPHIIKTLQSLYQCQAPQEKTEIILVFNLSEQDAEDKKQYQKTSMNEVRTWIKNHPSEYLAFHILETMLPPKHAGVGLARKIGMDQALYRFASLQKNGCIIALDADCTVEENYLIALEQAFRSGSIASASIHFEHPLENLNTKILTGIINYELYLRYYNQGLQYAGHPYAFHTVGSSMAVSALLYAQSGGMNKRKAGEDFYFLHKVIPHGKHAQIGTTCVYPEARISHRVPFGTGKALSDWVKQEKHHWETYPWLIFRQLKTFIDATDHWADQEAFTSHFLKLPSCLQAFLEKENFDQKLKEINQGTRELSTYRKRFFQWFNGFKVLKMVHFLRDQYYGTTPINKACQDLYKDKYPQLEWKDDALHLLLQLRAIEKGS